jgi:hypothetical protein
MSKQTISAAQIRSLADEARAHGDEQLWQTCQDAIASGSEAAMTIIRRVLDDAVAAAAE